MRRRWSPNPRPSPSPSPRPNPSPHPSPSSSQVERGAAAQRSSRVSAEGALKTAQAPIALLPSYHPRRARPHRRARRPMLPSYGTTLGVTIAPICYLRVAPTPQARVLEAEEQLAQLRQAHAELEARSTPTPTPNPYPTPTPTPNPTPNPTPTPDQARCAEGVGELEAAGWRAEALGQELTSPSPIPNPTPTPTPTRTCEPYPYPIAQT